MFSLGITNLIMIFEIHILIVPINNENIVLDDKPNIHSLLTNDKIKSKEVLYLSLNPTIIRTPKF